MSEKRPRRGRDKGEVREPLFDPLARVWRPLGETKQAQGERQKKEAARVEAEWLARHFQLDEHGRLPGGEAAQNHGVYHRKRRYAALTDFPRIPEGELERLEGIIRRYGLPLSALSSEIAAFVVRRVLMDFHRLSTLRRVIREPMFTPDELLQLLTQLQMNPGQFAEMVWPTNPNGARGNVYRWLHGISYPTGVMAIKVNRMIDLQVRKRKTGGVLPGEEGLSQDKETASRRRRWRRQQQAKDVPVARSAKEEADATERPDGHL